MKVRSLSDGSASLGMFDAICLASRHTLEVQ